MSTTEYALWQDQLHAEMNNPASARYSNVPNREWLWRAEGELNHTPEYRFGGTENGLLRGLSAWWEHADECGEDKIKCNEVVSFNRIDRHTAAFDETAYEADSHYIFWWLQKGLTPADGIYGEVLSVEGDLLSHGTGYFLVKWRNFDGGDQIDGSFGVKPYQYLSWYLGDEQQLVLARGNSAFLKADALIPEQPLSIDQCDGKNITCHVRRNESVDVNFILH